MHFLSELMTDDKINLKQCSWSLQIISLAVKYKECLLG